MGVAVIIFIIWRYWHFLQINEEVNNMKNHIIQLTNSSFFKNHIERAQAQYDNKTDTISLNLKLKDTYDELTIVQQFILLEYYQKQLKYYLRNNGSTSQIIHSRVQLFANTTTDNYLLINEIPEGNLFRSESVFYHNDKKRYTTNRFKQFRDKHLANLPEETFEKKVLVYATSFFRTLTQSGRTYRPEIDSQIILDTVCKKFNITQEEYSKIYQKYLLGMLDA